MREGGGTVSNTSKGGGIEKRGGKHTLNRGQDGSRGKHVIPRNYFKMFLTLIRYLEKKTIKLSCCYIKQKHHAKNGSHLLYRCVKNA